MSVVVGEGVSQVNKFEQVSSDGHQMSLAGGAWLGGGLHSDVKCIMGNGHMGIPHAQAHWQTHPTENITFSKSVGGW